MKTRYCPIFSLLLLLSIPFLLCAVAECQIDFSKNLGKSAQASGEDACKNSLSTKIRSDKQATPHFSYVLYERKDAILHVHGAGTYLQLVQTIKFSFSCDYDESSHSVIQSSYEEPTPESQVAHKAHEVSDCENEIQDSIMNANDVERVWTLPHTIVVKRRKDGKTFDVYGEAAAINFRNNNVRYKFKCTFKPDGNLTTDYSEIDAPYFGSPCCPIKP